MPALILPCFHLLCLNFTHLMLFLEMDKYNQKREKHVWYLGVLCEVNQRWHIIAEPGLFYLAVIYEKKLLMYKVVTLATVLGRKEGIIQSDKTTAISFCILCNSLFLKVFCRILGLCPYSYFHKETQSEFWEAFLQRNILESKKSIKAKFLTFSYRSRSNYCESLWLLDNNYFLLA
jgi:hypothetical protein